MSASTESAPSYDEFLAELGLLNRLCVDLRRGTVAGPLSRTGHTLPRLAYTPAITSLTSAIENYIQVAEHHVPSEEVWEELRAMKRGKERGRRETSFARAALVSIAALRLEVEKDEVTSKRNVELYQESLVRLIVCRFFPSAFMSVP
ncbi:hypothetical protein Rt10032_c02g0795 [Rhodotorula toruloides]|uniref:Uncharacterized protein n=1 Tax=Rhodotorula toruloides TaxID=5286 RepID=A0A511K8V6_RHOTO|nr:hypothetical protein Rt10032_c02g0795 [Rhodotorula toruloides]